MTRRVALPLLAVAACLGALLPARLAHAQARVQTPQFGTGIEIINLSLSVTDGRSNFVSDRPQKDVAVFEDGIRKDLSRFNHENRAT
jgi:hypothetical protein